MLCTSLFSSLEKNIYNSHFNSLPYSTVRKGKRNKWKGHVATSHRYHAPFSMKSNKNKNMIADYLLFFPLVISKMTSSYRGGGGGGGNHLGGTPNIGEYYN